MKRLPIILLLVSAALFVGAVVHLFQMRFASGDVFPKYSSLRSDPLGTKALFESLDLLIDVRRHFEPLHKLPDGRKTTLLYLGANLQELKFPPEQLKDLELFLSSGGRLVLSFSPILTRFTLPTRMAPPAKPSEDQSQPSDDTTEPDEETDKAADRKTRANEERSAKSRPVSLAGRWGFDYGYAALEKSEDDYLPAFASLRTDGALPKRIQVRTALHFQPETPPWRVIYAREEGQPVILEREFSGGTVILCADSFLLSNEAMLVDREAALLSWLVGPSTRAIFDETHLGVAEKPGIMNLIRKYRLHGVVGTFILLAALFAWKNSMSFLPPLQSDPSRDQDHLVQGRESTAGFINLLRRNIGSREILSVCLTEWKSSCSQGKPISKLQQIQAVLDEENQRPPKDRRPLQTYRTIHRILARHPGMKKS